MIEYNTISPLNVPSFLSFSLSIPYPYRWSSIRALHKGRGGKKNRRVTFFEKTLAIISGMSLPPYPIRRRRKEKKKKESFDSKLAPSSFYIFWGVRGGKPIPIVHPASKKTIRQPSSVRGALLRTVARREFPTSHPHSV